MQEDGTYPSLWEVPTFAQALEKRVQENAKTLLTRIKEHIYPLMIAFDDFMDRF